MAKKVIRRSPIITDDNIEKVLVENFVSLQKVMTTLAGRFDTLSVQISKLLELFELSAKSLAEKGYAGGDKKVAEKLDSLLGQNKLIAKGLVLLHEKGTPDQIGGMHPPQGMPIQQMAPMRLHPPVRRLEGQEEYTPSGEQLSQNPQPKPGV